MQFRVLGPVEVVADGAPRPLGGPKQRVVVGMLVAAAGRPVPVDSLLQAIYGEDACPGNKASLQTFVSNLRHVLGDVIVRSSGGYLIDCAPVAIDAVRFDDLVRAAMACSDPNRIAAGLREALATWRGDPYADVVAHGYLDGEITRLAELRLAALEARIDADMRTGRHRYVVAELDALTAEYPLRENLLAMHMLALYRSGRQAEALQAFAKIRVALVECLGIVPCAELQALEHRILEHDRSLIASPRPGG